MAALGVDLVFAGKGLNYLEAQCGDVVDFRCSYFLFLNKLIKRPVHFFYGQISDFKKFLVEAKAVLVFEAADERLSSVCVKQEFISGLKLNRVLGEFCLFENTEEGASYFEFLNILAGPD